MKKKFIYIFLNLIIILVLTTNVQAERPIIGIASIESNSARTKNIVNLFYRHLNNQFSISDVFDVMKERQLDAELEKYKCTDERCLIKFSKNIGLSVLVTGKVLEMGDSISITLKAYCFTDPYYNKLIYNYEAILPISGNNFSMGQYSYISEENSGRFISGFFKNYKRPVFAKKNKEGIYTFNIPDGDYLLFEKKDSFEVLPVYDKINKIEVKDNKVKNIKLNESFFVLEEFNGKSEFFSDFYFGRKKEIVFTNESFGETAGTLLFTPLLAPLQSIACPLAYLQRDDFSGLGLWGINFAPYAYITYQGYKNRPSVLDDDNTDILKKDYANYYFAIYHTFVGGISLFADAAAQPAMEQARLYGKRQGYYGNKYINVYLSAISGGGGHFYKGYRTWGYFYYHLNNILVYSTIYNYSRNRKYDSAAGKYYNERRDYKKAKIFLSITVAVKLVEIVHSSVLPEKIFSDQVEEDNYGFSFSGFYDDKNPNFAVSYYYRF